ncbi:hypothetical protein F4780DRAFT_730487 [Xylariomycetidae sp. FL0641]|nr:hypothetical protein F4780DRAFT_730487 [Xylariomycetidae sp. FL0641]
MSFAQELESFKTPTAKEIKPIPGIGMPAPFNGNLELPDDRPTIIVFLRHCGCPFAEKTFKYLTTLSSRHAKQAHFVAVSHSSAEATERWVVSVGGNWNVSVVIDEQRDLYAQFGLGVSNTWHVLSPLTLYKTLQLGKSENIWNRPTESGNRWQTSGAFAVDEKGIVRWRKIARSADEVFDLEEGLQAVSVKPYPKPPPEVKTYGPLR